MKYYKIINLRYGNVEMVGNNADIRRKLGVSYYVGLESYIANNPHFRDVYKVVECENPRKELKEYEAFKNISTRLKIYGNTIIMPNMYYLIPKLEEIWELEIEDVTNERHAGFMRQKDTGKVNHKILKVKGEKDAIKNRQVEGI